MKLIFLFMKNDVERDRKNMTELKKISRQIYFPCVPAARTGMKMWLSWMNFNAINKIECRKAREGFEKIHYFH